MKTQSDIAQRANETLDSINNLQQVEANSFLFSKIQNRMQAKSQQQVFVPVKILSRLSVALVLFIGLNVASYYFLSGNSPKQTVQQKTTAAQALATEYHLTTDGYNY